MDDLNVHLVEDLESAGEFLRWLGERRPILAIDTETTGLQWWTPNFLRLVQFGDGATGWSVSAKKWWGVIETALRRYSGPTVFQNCKFDLHALESDSLSLPDLRTMHDTLTMSHLLDSSKPTGLKATAARLFGQEAKAGDAMLRTLMQKNKWTWATVPDDLPAYWAYAALDTVLTARIYEHHQPLVDLDIYEREMEVIRILYGAENRGLLVDVDHTRALHAEWEAEMETLYLRLAEYGINSPNANKQIEAAIREADPDWEPDDWTDNGQAKLDKNVLTRLGHEIGPLVLRLRRLRKWKKVYLEGFLNNQGLDGRLHPNIKTLGARTGRMSIDGGAGPLQTLPRGPEVRNCIIPAPGKSFVSVDYDTMEYRVFASYSGAAAIQQAIKDGVDLHRLTASMAYSISMDEVSKQQRQISKNSAYGRIYGAQAGKIAETVSAPDTDGSFTEVSPSEVQAFLDAFDNKIPEVKTFMDQVQALGSARLREDGQAWVRTVGGRRLPGDPDRIYALVNYLVQGSCADIFKNKIIELSNAGYEEFIILPVHDEVIFEIPTQDYDDLTPEFERIMQDTTTFNVPLTVAASGPLERWGQK